MTPDIVTAGEPKHGGTAPGRGKNTYGNTSGRGVHIVAISVTDQDKEEA